MKRFVLFVLVAGLALAVSGAWALTLQPNVSTWQTWDVSDLDENGTPYWDGNSSDYGTQPANIGYWLTKQGAFAPGGSAPNSVKNASPGVPYPYLGNSDGSAITDVYFQATTPNWAAIKIEIAGLRNTNVFGIYEKDNPSNKQQLFSGSAGPGATIVFTPNWADFGFYLHDTAAGRDYIWYSQSRFNEKVGTGLVDHELQHFAFFRATPPNAAYPAYYIGVEDLPNLGDKDYQDLVVYVQAIPDASSWMLFLSGMPALALLRRKRA